MDHFGIDQALRSMVECYFITSRQTGRTASLLDSLRTGDRVVCLDSREAHRLRRLCMERALKVEVLVVAPDRAHELPSYGPAQGRTLFEHTWLEEFYRRAIKRAGEQIDELQRRMSSHGELHRVTPRCALERARWGRFD